MPISEDEIDQSYGSHQSQMHTGNMSKAEQRRSNKPIMEKRRRARINHCLNELKSLILDAMKKDPARHSKLEKADILEMTVKHLQTIQRQQLSLAVSSDPTVVHKFKTGFNECAGEVSRYIGRMEGVEPGVKQRLVSHLASCVSGLQQISPFSLPGSSSGSHNSVASEDVNNNTASARLQMMTGLQLIPSRLPTGELALLLPNSQHLPFFPAPLENQVSTTSESPNATVTSNVDRSHNSAFTAVHREKFYSKSPLPSPTSTTASSYGDDSCDQPYPSPSHPHEVTSTSEHPVSFLNYQQTPKGLETQSLPIPFADLTKEQNQTFSKRFSINTSQTPLTEQNQTFSKRFSINTSQTPLTEHNQTFSKRFSIDTSQTPLTVITSNEIKKEHPQRFLEARQTDFKDPLDFSVKKETFSLAYQPYKRPFQEDMSDKLLIKTTEYQPALKIPKVSQTQITHELSDRRLFEIQNQVPTISAERQIHPARLPERSLLEIQNQPSTSTEVSRDMWRPW